MEITWGGEWSEKERILKKSKVEYSEVRGGVE